MHRILQSAGLAREDDETSYRCARGTFLHRRGGVPVHFCSAVDMGAFPRAGPSRDQLIETIIVAMGIEIASNASTRLQLPIRLPTVRVVNPRSAPGRTFNLASCIRHVFPRGSAAHHGFFW